MHDSWKSDCLDVWICAVLWSARSISGKRRLRYILGVKDESKSVHVALMIALIIRNVPDGNLSTEANRKGIRRGPLKNTQRPSSLKCTNRTKLCVATTAEGYGTPFDFSRSCNTVGVALANTFTGSNADTRTVCYGHIRFVSKKVTKRMSPFISAASFPCFHRDIWLCDTTQNGQQAALKCAFKIRRQFLFSGSFFTTTYKLQVVLHRLERSTPTSVVLSIPELRLPNWVEFRETPSSVASRRSRTEGAKDVQSVLITCDLNAQVEGPSSSEAGICGLFRSESGRRTTMAIDCSILLVDSDTVDANAPPGISPTDEQLSAQIVHKIISPGGKALFPTIFSGLHTSIQIMFYSELPCYQKEARGLDYCQFAKVKMRKLGSNYGISEILLTDNFDNHILQHLDTIVVTVLPRCGKTSCNTSTNRGMVWDLTSVGVCKRLTQTASEYSRLPVTPIRCLNAMSPGEKTRGEIIPGCPGLYMSSQDAEIGFKPRTVQPRTGQTYIRAVKHFYAYYQLAGLHYTWSGMHHKLTGFINEISDKNLIDMEHADVVFIFKEKEKVQVFSNELTKVIPFFGFPFRDNATKYAFGIPAWDTARRDTLLHIRECRLIKKCL
ncbi:hypothetical protein CLF_105817 [Clonorchis sinensis]|uniref:Uncharacterized protein n=1 Tax=Clonorchis sinensis TaxID=79923 RepID=G7YE92_CLOSI|nr:hypothetical protein CLF_105817 [Clonorchis sinensis]